MAGISRTSGPGGHEYSRLAPRSVVGAYEIVSLLGEGGMGRTSDDVGDPAGRPRIGRETGRGRSAAHVDRNLGSISRRTTGLARVAISVID